jgi:hypothetical protein
LSEQEPQHNPVPVEISNLKRRDFRLAKLSMRVVLDFAINVDFACGQEGLNRVDVAVTYGDGQLIELSILVLQALFKRKKCC